MGKCEFCGRKTKYVCSHCSRSFCKEHGDLDRMLCDDCLELSEIQKETEREMVP